MPHEAALAAHVHHVKPTHASVAADRPRAALDPRTFHLFDSDGVYFFYNVATGEFAEVNKDTHALLTYCRACDWPEVDRRMADCDPQWRHGDAQRLLSERIDDGHFHYAPLNVVSQSAAIEVLWRHRPRRLQLLLAQHCNLRCIYCYEEFNGSNGHQRLMSVKTAKQAVDYLVHRSGGRRMLQITFFGGEPLLNKKVLKWTVSYCKEIESQTEKRFVFELITNATLLDEEMLDYITEHRFLLMISLDGYREMHEFNRPAVSGKRSFDTVLANAKRAVRRYRGSGIGLPVKVRSNLTHEHHDVDRVVRFLEGEGFSTIGIAAVDELPWYEGKGHGCTPGDLEDVRRANRTMLEQVIRKTIARQRCSPYEAKLVRGALKRIGASKAPRGLGCGVGRNTNIVDTEGDIYPCHRYGDMSAYRIGNVKDMVLNEERMLAYYSAVNDASSGKCASCWGRNLCGGPCAWEVSAPTGAVLEPSPEHCKRILEGFEYTLLLRRRLLKEAPHLVPETDACGAECGP